MPCDNVLQVLNEFLTNSGNQVGGDYVLGGQYSIADVYTAPLLATGSAFLEAYRDFDVLAEARQRGLHRFVSWAEVCWAIPFPCPFPLLR